ncbi:hypothetical protein SEVIR_3G316545v4 [Setaria viridis]
MKQLSGAGNKSDAHVASHPPQIFTAYFCLLIAPTAYLCTTAPSIPMYYCSPFSHALSLLQTCNDNPPSNHHGRRLLTYVLLLLQHQQPRTLLFLLLTQAAPAIAQECYSFNPVPCSLPCTPDALCYLVCRLWTSSSSSTHSMSATIRSREAVPRSGSSTSSCGCVLGALQHLWTLSRHLQ